MATSAADVQRHASPHLGGVAVVFTVLFLASLYPVTALGGKPTFPSPWESAQTIAAFFQLRPKAALLCAFLQFGSAVPLGIFTATVVSRLRFLGMKVAGTYIALFGGFAAAFAVASSAMVMWVMAHPGVAQEATVTQALYYLGFALGGPGYSVPFGLLMAGISVPAFIGRVAPRWIAVLGLVLAVVAELSWLDLVIPQAVVLIPLTRFPGFVWMIAMGFALPATKAGRRGVLQG